MHVPTHLLSGWCVANLFELTPRERLFCMIAASMADVDGLSYAFGEAAYQQYHHLLGHNLTVGVVGAAAMAMNSVHRAKGFLLYLFLAHVHLVLDYLGSGPYWPIYYLWPFDWSFKVINKEGWEFSAWQNKAFAGAFLAWALVIAFRQGRTPVEMITPRLDQAFVRWLRATVRRTRPVRAR